MTTLYKPQPRFDVLKIPLIGRLLRWKWGRLVFQIILLLVAALMLYDGFTGPQLAPENMATVLAWVHYRGFVVFGFLLLGNLFCMGCPFTIPRTLAKRVAISGRRWPKALRNKWLAIGMLFLIFFLYEWLDLWASPWLTAWVTVAYFVGSFALEAFFSESPFCKYVCPLGTFNFVSSTISPLQITVNDRDVCRSCVGKECINGSTHTAGKPITRGSGNVINIDNINVLGCGTELFPPQIKSNMDCLFCLDCARACPYDNVALGFRNPLTEVKQGSWAKRWDLSFLMLIFAFASLGNAFGMVPPVFQLEIWLGNLLGTTSEAPILLIIFAVINLILPLSLGTAAAWLSRFFAEREEPLQFTLARYAPAFAPLAFAVWLAHYGGFHFLSSAAGIVPVTQNFLQDHGLTFLGEPDWTMSAIVPLNWLNGFEFFIVMAGLLVSLYVLGERAKRARPHRDTPLAQLPWLILLAGLALAAIWIFYLPMEMRGTPFVG